MLITIKYFGQIAEVTNKNEEQITLKNGRITDVLTILQGKYTNLSSKDFKIAQGQELANLETELTGQDIALLPPFAGG